MRNVNQRNYRKRVATGIVRGTNGDFIEALLEYNKEGERTLCNIPKNHWGDNPIIIDQNFEMEWNENNLDEPPIVRCLNNITSDYRIARKILKKAYGLDSSSKILVVVGGNRPDLFQVADSDALLSNLQRHLTLKTAGWGECLCLTRILPLFSILDIPPNQVDIKLCEVDVADFIPKDHIDRTIIFLGSPKSNVILSHHYWEQSGLAKKFTFEDFRLKVIDPQNDLAYWEFDSNDNFNDKNRYETRAMKAIDYFILTKTVNPYSSKSKPSYIIVLAGVGTIGTGYAGVTFIGKRSIKKILTWMRNDCFDIACLVKMNGMFNPDDDPVNCVFDGSRQINDILLPSALKSPTVWSKESAYIEEDFKNDLDKLTTTGPAGKDTILSSLT